MGKSDNSLLRNELWNPGENDRQKFKKTVDLNMSVIDRNSKTQVFLRSVLSTSTRNTRAWGCSRDPENVSEMLRKMKLTNYGACLKSRVIWKKTRIKPPMLFLETKKTQINEPLQTKQVQCTCYKTCVSDFRFDASKCFCFFSPYGKNSICGFYFGGSPN